MTAEIRKLQGTWNVETLEIDGRPLNKNLFTGAHIVVMGDRFSSRSMGAVYEGSLRVNSTKKPFTIDMVFDSGPEAGSTALGIYELDASLWKLCLTVTSKIRPTQFRTAPGSGHAFETLKRARAGSAKGAIAREARAEATVGEPIPELEGEWSMVSCSRGGDPLDPSLVASGRRVTSGNSTTTYFGKQVSMKAKVAVDRSVNPYAIDFLQDETVQRGIFTAAGDRVTISFATKGMARPDDFEAAPGRTVTVWKKI